MVESMKFDITVINNSTREIEGRATLPVVDDEHEIILKSAIEHALPYFMELPVMTYNHSERPVGLWHEAYFGDDGGLYVKGRVKSSPDADDVWELIEKGKISSLSITGKRLEGSPSCRLKPKRRTEPCQTKKAYMYAITLCGDTKINVNPAACVNIAEAIGKGRDPFEYETEVESMTDTTEPEIQDVVVEETPIEKGADLAPLLEAIGTLSEKIDAITKAEPEPVEKEETNDYVEKASLDKSLETIAKSIEKIEGRFAELEERLEKIEENPIQKAAVDIDRMLGESTSNVGALGRVIKGA